MKKINKFMLAIIMVAAVFTSCDDTGKTPEVNDTLKLKITAKDWEGNNVDFKDGEIVGVYANKGTSLVGDRFLNNEIFTKKESFFKASKEVEIPTESTLFVAYKPYNNVTLANDIEETNISVKTNQSSISDYVSSDLIMGCATHNADGVKELPIEIKRMFSNISISISTGDNSELDLTGADILFNLNTTAKVNFSKASIIEVSEVKEIIPKGYLKYQEDVYKGVSFITVPQKVVALEEFITLTLEGEETLISADKEIEFKGGMKYELEFIVDKVGVDYTVEFTITEEPWALGNDIDETLDIDSNEIESVTDVQGNKYDVVKIGKQFWMASNLITQKYNDGTDISFLTGNTEWQNATYSKEGGFVYYQLNEANIAKYGLYYNFFSVNSGKLCPKGWRIPSQDDYKILMKELGGADKAHAAMKSTSGWEDWDYQELPEYQGTNSSGMNVVPAGYRLDGGEFKNQKEFAYFWTRSISNDYRSYAIVLASQNTEVLIDNDFHRAVGMAVRCVKY